MVFVLLLRLFFIQMDAINSIRLDTSNTFIALSLGTSISIYSIDPMKRKYQKEFFNYKIKQVAVSDDGTLLVFVGTSIEDDSGVESVFIYSTYFEEPEKQIDFTDPIQNIVLRKKFLLIILQNSICVYNILSKETHYEQITSLNELGAGDLNLDEDQPMIAVCGLVQGTVRVSLITDERPIFFNAHQHCLNTIRFSPDSSLIATSSQEGTIVKLFDAATGSLLASFRRGNVPRKILAMAISPGNSLLAVLSDNATIHVFPADLRVGENDDPPRASIKVKLEKSFSADMCFRSRGSLIVAASNGFFYDIDCKAGKITTKLFILSH